MYQLKSTEYFRELSGWLLTFEGDKQNSAGDNTYIGYDLFKYP